MRPTYPTWRQAYMAAGFGVARLRTRHRVTSYHAITGERRWLVEAIPNDARIAREVSP